MPKQDLGANLLTKNRNVAAERADRIERMMPDPAACENLRRRHHIPARLPSAYPRNRGPYGYSCNLLVSLAHPTRFERVTFAFGGQRSTDAGRLTKTTGVERTRNGAK